MLEALKRIKDTISLGGWIIRDATFIAAQVQVDCRAAQRWLPAGLKVARSGTATLFVAQYPHTTFGSVYNEAALFLDVTHLGRPCVHCPWILVDDDVALILGREVLGYPKKMGTIEIEREGDVIRAAVRRRGAEILRLTGRVGASVADPPPMLQRPTRNAMGTVGLSPQRLVAFTIREEVRECHAAELELEVFHAPRDPLRELAIGPPQAGYVYRLNVGANTVPLPLPVGLLSPLYTVRNYVLRYQ